MTDEKNKEDQTEDPNKNKSAEDEDEDPEKKEDEDDPNKEDPNKDKPEKKEDEDKSGGKEKRTPRMMELYKHKIAEKKWDKEKEGLENKIVELSNKSNAKPKPEKAKLIKAFAEKSGMDESLIEELVDITNSSQPDLTKELADLRSQVKKGDEARIWVEEDKRFETDFEKTVISLIETDAVPKENIPRLKKLLKTLAFTEEYAKTPLKVIYRGVDDFRQFSKKGRKSGESTRGGIRGEEIDSDWLDLSEEEFEKKIKEEANKQGETKFNIRRDGKFIKD